MPFLRLTSTRTFSNGTGNTMTDASFYEEDGLPPRIPPIAVSFPVMSLWSFASTSACFLRFVGYSDRFV